jgi:hypothetical protein
MMKNGGDPSPSSFSQESKAQLTLGGLCFQVSLTAPIRTRLSAAFFGAFCLVLLALRQQGFVVRNKNPSKNSR